MPCTSPRAQPLALPSARGLRQRCSAFRFILRATGSRIAIFITGASRSAADSCWSASSRFDAASPTPRRSVRSRPVLRTWSTSFGCLGREGRSCSTEDGGGTVPVAFRPARNYWSPASSWEACSDPSTVLRALRREASRRSPGRANGEVGAGASRHGCAHPSSAVGVSGPVTRDVLLRTSQRSPPPLHMIGSTGPASRSRLANARDCVYAWQCPGVRGHRLVDRLLEGERHADSDRVRKLGAVDVAQRCLIAPEGVEIKAHVYVVAGTTRLRPRDGLPIRRRVGDRRRRRVRPRSTA